MKKPYIKKFGKISKFTVWIVDGEYIRKNIDEEFTNYGQHYLFNFIPKYEFWIDQEKSAGEEKYYIDSMLTMNRLMSQKISHREAVKKADVIERRERAKTRLIKNRLKLKKNLKKLISSVHKNLLQEYSTKNVKVWIVDGEAVRGLFFVDFTEGGHGFVYPFIPKGEVWIDDDVEFSELKFVLLHEMYERRLMSKWMPYDKAHKKSSEIEFYCRHHQKKLDEILKKEIKDNGRIK